MMYLLGWEKGKTGWIGAIGGRPRHSESPSTAGILVVAAMVLWAGSTRAGLIDEVGDALTEQCAALAAPWWEGRQGIPYEGIDPALAVPACEGAVAASPSNGDSWAFLARALSKAGRYDDAWAATDRAVELGSVAGLWRRGLAYELGESVASDDLEAIKWYRLGAEKGYPPAQNNLGGMYQDGLGVEQSDLQAVRWYQVAAEQGHSVAQNNLGLMYEEGRGVERDDAEAVRWYRLAAEQGDPYAQTNLGLMYENDRGVRPDRDEDVLTYQDDDGRIVILVSDGDRRARLEVAVEWFRRAAELDHPLAQYHMGRMYQHGLGVVQDSDEAISWYKRAALAGDLSAQLKLAGFYQWGYRGIDRNWSEAAKWYGDAAAQGAPEAYYQLGLMYQTGQGVYQDDDEAEKWYRLALAAGITMAEGQLKELFDKKNVEDTFPLAESGDLEAQFSLGDAYLNGVGVPVDYAEAVKWYQLAGEQGHAGAQNMLGWMFYFGRGVEEDGAEALKWFGQAAAQEYAEAYYGIGTIHFDGFGVETDPDEGMQWFLQALEHGDADLKLEVAEDYIDRDYRSSVDRVVTAIVDLLDDDTHEMRRDAVRLLGFLSEPDDPRVTHFIIPMLLDSSPDVRSKAAEALGRLKAMEAVDYLIPHLNDEEFDVRADAARALGQIGDPRAVQPLIQCLEHVDSPLSCLMALAAIGDPSAAPFVIPMLEPTMDGKNVRAREEAALALGRFGSVLAVDPLIVSLQDPDRSVRAAAAWALGSLGDHRAVQPLEELLARESSSTSTFRDRAYSAAEEALSQLRQPPNGELD